MKRYYLLALILISAFLSLSVMTMQAQNVIRGPYLQSSGPTIIIVCWRTDVPSDSRVYYGSSHGSNTYYADEDSISTEHRVKISGLSPRTKYYYTIGSSAQVLKGDAQMYFTTAPDPANPTPIRFWAIGDFGHGNDRQRWVRDAYLDYTVDHPADFQIWLGDNVYQDGTDLEYSTKVFDSINGYYHLFKNQPFFPAPGNHDYNSICPWQGPCNTDPYLHSGPYLDFIEPPTEGELGGVPSHLKLFYSYDYGDAHFISLNSELGSITQAYNWVGLSFPPFTDANYDTSFTSPMIEWLKNDIASTDKKWIIAYWHQCPYSGQDDFTEAGTFQLFTYAARRHFNPILERYGVDLVLTGHDHNYQRSYLINGLYDFKAAFTPSMIIDSSSGDDTQGESYVKYTDGPLANKGTVYVVQGNSSGSNGASPFDHPVIYWGQACDTCCGSLIVDIDGDRLDAQYLTGHGEVLDRFTILKRSTTGIDDRKYDLKGATISPNPFYGYTHVDFSLPQRSIVRIEALDLSGKSVHSFYSGIREPGTFHDVLDFDNAQLPPGTYIVKLQAGGASMYLKAVKAG